MCSATESTGLRVRILFAAKTAKTQKKYFANKNSAERNMSFGYRKDIYRRRNRYQYRRPAVKKSMDGQRIFLQKANLFMTPKFFLRQLPAFPRELYHSTTLEGKRF